MYQTDPPLPSRLPPQPTQLCGRHSENGIFWLKGKRWVCDLCERPSQGARLTTVAPLSPPQKMPLWAAAEASGHWDRHLDVPGRDRAPEGKIRRLMIVPKPEE